MPSTAIQTEAHHLFKLGHNVNNEFYMRTIYLQAGFITTVTAHMFLYLGNFVALGYLIFNEPWYFGVISCTFAFSPALNGVFCAFTNLENYFRYKLKKEIIPDDALSYYLRQMFGGGKEIKIIT